MRISRSYLVAVAVVAFFATTTWFLRVGALADLDGNIERQQSARISNAFRVIDDEFQSIQREMVALAEHLSRAPEVRQTLGDVGNFGTDDQAALVAFFASERLPALTSVELYSPTPRLLAWHGFSMPLDDAPAAESFLQRFQTSITREENNRVALVLWWPIREGPRVYGVVRVVRILKSQTPVQNQYLRDYNIARQWARKSGLTVEASFGRPGRAAPIQPWRELRGVDGTILGVASATAPSPDDMRRTVRSRYDSVVAFWGALAIFLLASWSFSIYGKRLDGRPAAAGVRWLVFTAVLWLGRFGLLWLRFPERLQQGKSPFAPLFDPSNFASDMFGGVMRTTGDLIVTSVLCGITAVTFYRLVVTIARDEQRYASWSRPALVASVVGCLLTMFGLIALISATARNLVLDSTLDYFARSGLVPDSLVLAVFSSALVAVAAAVVASAAVALWMFTFVRALQASGWPKLLSLVAPALVGGIVVGLLYVLFPLGNILSPRLGASLFAGFSAAAATLYYWDRSGTAALSLRNALFGVFVVAAFLYPMLYSGLLSQKRSMLVDAAENFDKGSDPRVVFSIEKVLEDAANDSLAATLLSNGSGSASAFDSLATLLLRPSLLASLRSYEVSLTFIDDQGMPRGRYYEADQQITKASLQQLEVADFDLLRAMYVDAGGPATLVEQITGRHERERFRYHGLRPIRRNEVIVGWVMAGAEPRSMAEEVGSPFPRVFVSTGFYGGLGQDISLAEFRDGVLVRTTGASFGRLRLDEDVRDELRGRPSVWRRDQTRGRIYETFYLRRQDQRSALAREQTVVVASRTAATTAFDHLYSLLRLTVAGLFVALPLYLFGILLRWRAGQLPARRVRFRDKVLNAFFAVGIITVAAMGFVGLQVVTGENDRAVDSWLKQHLERVERTLASEARAGELPYRVLDRMSLDSLATRVGLDLNLFQGADLVASSRPQLIRDRLIDSRLPIAAYSALNYEGYRFISTSESVGTVSYAAGFRALPDEVGRPRYILSVPTLPEQERIEEERARTVAYLFGALLLLVLVVLATASVLANALTRPIGRLQVGLEAVAQGRFERIRPVDTRDEFGDLVETFNTMQGQLSDSRRRLAQQERQLAWQEMARQVAHEIKNPLTPMKLSVQHLQRSLDGAEVEDPEFKSVFARITKTLVEQIDALARIANEFSSFARMPRQIFEPLDVNAVLREAAALMQAENGTTLNAEYADDTLIVNADREELRRVFINLIKNAVQSVPVGREPVVSVMTRLESRDGADMVYCRIADNGVGVPDALRDRIFEPNFSTKTSGTGLGLAIVRKAVEDMHGTIGFETSADTGSTFWIRLPRAVDPPVSLK